VRHSNCIAPLVSSGVNGAVEMTLFVAYSFVYLDLGPVTAVSNIFHNFSNWMFPFNNVLVNKCVYRPIRQNDSQLPRYVYSAEITLSELHINMLDYWHLGALIGINCAIAVCMI